jgi:hypothetical protein
MALSSMSHGLRSMRFWISASVNFAARRIHSAHASRLRDFRSLTIGLLCTVALLSRPCAADSAVICGGCELSLGVGDTYHFWGRTGGLVLPATLTWGHSQYEIGVFRMSTAQKLYEDIWGKTRVLAEPYWGVSASRRWQLIMQPTWRLFFGFGASFKTQEDLLNSTHWNFASQLALRLHHPDGTGSDMEFAIRHWSNAGIRCPNRGQDLFTVVIAF